MFRKLLLIVAFVAVGAGAYGVARAYFSSQAPVKTATFQAGTININLEQHPGYNSVPFSMQNWMPGQTQDVVVDVVNNSTVPVTLTGGINGTWGTALGDHFVSVVGAYYWGNSDWVALTDYDSHGNFVYGITDGSPIPAGGLVTMKMRAKFDENAGNEYQNQTYSADIVVTAHQVETPL